MNSGKKAEQAAALHLNDNGFDIIQTNWKTPACEIDIVATKSKKSHWYQRAIDEVYFVEVKYRKTSDFGQPLDYVTKTKLARMERAAKIWTQQHEWSGPIHLSAVGVTGSDYAIADVIEDIYI